MTEKSIKTGANSRNGVIVSNARKGVINPGPSPKARTRIKRFQGSSARAEQRLGMTRLASRRRDRVMKTDFVYCHLNEDEQRDELEANFDR